MDKNSVFFTIHSISPKDSRHFYFHSTKKDSNNLLNYMTDAHSFDDVGGIKDKLTNYHDKEIFDIKQGNVSFEKLQKPNKNSYIFTGLVSFDDKLSKSGIFKLYWQDISNIIFQTLITKMDWDINDWEMQSNMHYNTNNKHIQFKIYQNDKTKKENIFKQFWLKKPILEEIKQKIWNFVDQKQNNPILNFTHCLKADAIYDNNKQIKQNKALIMDFVNLIRISNKTDKVFKKSLSNITEIYFSRQWFSKWIDKNLNKYNLTNAEIQQIEAIIKNNISAEIYSYVQNHKKAKAYDFIVKKDPMDKSISKQKFKNFDKINKESDFEKIASYQNSTIEMIYKEPFSRFIDMTLNSQQFNLSELEKSISNYLISIRPNIKETISVSSKNLNSQSILSIVDDNYILKLCELISLPSENYNKEKQNYIVLVDKYYETQWFKYWIKNELKSFNLSDIQKEHITKIIKTSILDRLYDSIQSNLNEKMRGFGINNGIKTDITLYEASNEPSDKILTHYKNSYLDFIKYEFNSTLVDGFAVEDKINEYLSKIRPENKQFIEFRKPQILNKNKV